MHSSSAYGGVLLVAGLVLFALVNLVWLTWHVFAADAFAGPDVGFRDVLKTGDN